MVSRTEPFRGSRLGRSLRLLAVCVGTAVVLAAVVSVLAPKVLIGGVTGHAADVAVPVAAKGAPGAPLPITGLLKLDPREERGNAVRWGEIPADERQTLLERYWHLAELSADEQQKAVEAYHAFRKLPSDQQVRLRDRAKKLDEFMKTLSQQDLAMLKGMNDRQRAERVLQLWQARYGTW